MNFGNQADSTFRRDVERNSVQTAASINALMDVTAVLYSGSGSPEGVIVAPIGSLYTRTDGGTGTTLYVKESGTDENGWVAK